MRGLQVQLYSHHQVLLIQGFAIEELVEVHYRAVDIQIVIRIGTSGFRVLSLNDVEIVRDPVRSLSQIRRVLGR